MRHHPLEPGLPVFAGDAFEEDLDVGAQLFFRRFALTGDACHFVGFGHQRDPAAQDLHVETEFIAKVIVHRGDVRACGIADVAYRHVMEPALRKQIASGIRIDGLVMMGDQIYADDLNLLSPDTAIDEFLSRYRNVFSQPGLRQLMSRVPTYMVLDDHEIEDNWPSKATDKDWLTLYPAAIHAYQIYQCSHSPLFTLGPTGRIEGTIDKFWYTFQDGCCDWFIMDSRSERKWDENPKHRRMIKPTQMEALLGWLNDGSGQVKMVVTSVPFFPDLEEENDDKWGGFISERTEILDHILENKIRKVVFLSGDVHCSFSIELTSPKDPGFKVISVISSSFFWPYPHMEEGDFQMKGKLAAPKNGNVYRVGSASDVFNTDNFARVEVTPAQIVVSFFERKGKQLGTPVVRTF